MSIRKIANAENAPTTLCALCVHVILEVVNVALDDLVKFIASMTPLGSSIHS